MAGKLEFSLGLAAGNFLSNVSKASGAVKGFVGGMIGLGAISHGIWQQIEKGAKLNDLAKETGESVASLYKLQKGFKAAGLDSEGLGGMIFRLNSALGGVNEAGEPTGKVFSQIGLRIADLKKMNAADAIGRITAQLGKLDKQGATSAAGKVFGRYSAREFLLLARSTKEFSEGMRGAAEKAAMMNRSANTFEHIERSMEKVKGKMQDIWLPVADALGPILEKVTTRLAKMDFFSFGKRIGEELQIAFNAVDLGKFEAYFTLSLKAGVFESMNLLTELAGKLDLTGKNKEKEKGPGVWGKAWEGTKGVGAGLLGMWDEMGAMMGVPGAQKWSDKRFDQAYGAFCTAGINDGILSRVADAAAKGIQGGKNPYTEELSKMRSQLLAATKRSSVADSVGSQELKATKVDAMTGSKLEKMGFVFGGAGSGDHARTTAQNTGRMVTLLERMADRSVNYADPLLDRSPMNLRA